MEPLEKLTASALTDAEHIARCAEALMTALNEQAVAIEGMEAYSGYHSGIDKDAADEAERALDAANDARTEAWRSLRSAIYEFRKRRDRVTSALEVRGPRGQRGDPLYADIDGKVVVGDPEDPQEVQAVAAWLREQYDVLPGFGWLDGGCFVLALSMRALGRRYGFPATVACFYRENGSPDHFLAKPSANGRYFDGDGFATAEEVVWKMRELEGVDGHLEDIDDQELDRIMAASVFWHSRGAIEEICDRMDKAFGPRLLLC